MTLIKTREQYITDGLRTWTMDAGGMSVLCDDEGARESMVDHLNKEYDKLIANDTDRKE